MKTRRNIYLDLQESDYSFVKGGLRFYFSSEVYKEKFKKEIDSFINAENTKFEKKYGFCIGLETYFSVVFYSQIEKRGFRIIDDINKKELSKSTVFINNILCY